MNEEDMTSDHLPYRVSLKIKNKYSNKNSYSHKEYYINKLKRYNSNKAEWNFSKTYNQFVFLVMKFCFLKKSNSLIKAVH